MRFYHIVLSVALAGVMSAWTAAPAVASSSVHDDARSFLFFGKKGKKGGSKSGKDAEQSAAAATTPFEKIMTDTAKVDRGMFDVIRNGDDYYFQIPLGLMGRDLLVVNKLVRVPKELSDANVSRGMNTSNLMVTFEVDPDRKKVLMRESRTMPEVPIKDAIAQSVADNYINPLIASFPLEAYNPDSTAVLIKVNDLFNGKSDVMGDVFADINLGTSTLGDLSRIVSLKAFDDNVYGVSELTTRVVEPGGSVNVTVEVGTSIVLLPAVPMTGRYSSSRIGYFTNNTLRYSDDQQRVDSQRLITRWRLEPREEDRDDYLAGRLVEPKKPIVFYLDASTPAQWRPYIKQGILEWQRAFEMAGFKNAIQVRDMPEGKEADRDDINYSVVTYAASRFRNAMGPSITDPRSGEIIEADIMWWHNVIDLVGEWIKVQTAAVDERARQPKLSDELLGDAMRFVACHEVGHSLGLRHNMIASAAIPTDSLRSVSFTNMLNGTSSSIMDYARFNYVAQPGDGVKVLSPNLGPYDMLAIEYGYRWYPECDPAAENVHLENLLSHYDGLPMYAYSEAQEVRGAIDPRALSEDLGDNNVKAARYGVANLKRIMPNVIEWSTTGEKGQTYDDAARLYSQVTDQWQRYMYHVLSNIGGIYVDNNTVGSGRKTYRYVEKERQREALKFLLNEAFLDNAWLYDSPLNDYTFVVNNTPIGRVEQSPALMLSTVQSFLLWDLLNNERIVRMFENENRNGKDAFTAIEFSDMVHDAFFGLTRQGRTLSVRERAMQKNYVDALTIAACEKAGLKDGIALTDQTSDHLMASLNGFPGMCCGYDHAATGQDCRSRILNFMSNQSGRVSDAVSIKRAELMRIRTLLKNRVNTTADKATRYHYADLLMRINTALGLPLE